VAGAGRADDGNRVRVRLYSGSLSSQDRLGALAGGNLLAVQNAEGAWEILSARNTELVEEGVYELSGLLRGLAGTEGAMASPVTMGAPVVVVDTALTPLPMAEYERGAAMQFGAGAAGVQPAAANFEAIETSWDDVARRPLAPVHLRGRREPDGVRISWTRRSRIGGDSWSGETPLGEEAESYRIEILSGGAVALTLTSAAPEILLTLAQEAAVFGGPVWSFEVRVYQMSASHGPGAPAQRTLYLTP